MEESRHATKNRGHEFQLYHGKREREYYDCNRDFFARAESGWDYTSNGPMKGMSEGRVFSETWGARRETDRETENYKGGWGKWGGCTKRFCGREHTRRRIPISGSGLRDDTKPKQ